MATRPRTTPRPPSRAETSRALPLSIAGVCCVLLAILLGFLWSYLWGTPRRPAPGDNVRVVQTSPVVGGEQTPSPEATPQPSPSSTSEPESTPAQTPAPAGELRVAAGVAMLGGEGTDQPVRRETVGPFAIAETEVTNEQYNEFVKETGRSLPSGWDRGEYPADIPNNPVAGVTWQDAVDYCAWLSKKIGATVRLPSEKEWVLAAAGPENFKFPWGNDWNPRAANYKEERGGVILAVRSYPEFRSPCGAYDMAGNVWEWVSDDAFDRNGKPLATGGVRHKIIKGGSAGAQREYLLTRARFDLHMNTRDPWIGFRYVVIRDNAGQPAAP